MSVPPLVVGQSCFPCSVVVGPAGWSPCPDRALGELRCPVEPLTGLRNYLWLGGVAGCVPWHSGAVGWTPGLDRAAGWAP